MSNKRTKLLAFGKAFIEKMNENDIWFSADVEMILGAQRHGGFVPWNERLQVIMTPESFTKVQRLFPDNIVSTYYTREYKSLKPVFVEDRKNWKEEQPFVEIRVVVPTTLKKIKHFRSRTRYALNYLKGRRDSTKEAINELIDIRHEGFYVVGKRFSPSINNWIPNITFNMEEMIFNNMKVPVIKEWKPWLIINFGENYMEAKIPGTLYTYDAPLAKSKEEE